MITLVEDLAEPELIRRGFHSEASVQMRHRILNKASIEYVDLSVAI